MKNIKKWGIGLAVGILSLILAACGSTKDSKIVIYDGQFSEMRIIHQMVKLLVEKNTDISVDIKDEMSPVNSYNEILKGNADLMNSYDGTLLTTYLHLDPSDVSQNMSLYDFANQKAESSHVRLLDKLGINNTYAIGVSEEVAKMYNLETISDLVPVADKLIFGAEHDFFTEEGSAKFNPFVKFYGLKFKEAKQIDLSLKYATIENGKTDVMVVYATDGLNRKANLKILKDDKTFFPEYNGALLVRTDLFERYKDAAPNLEQVLNQMGGILTNEDMVNLTYEVDVNGKTATAVAEQFLKEKGLL